MASVAAAAGGCYTSDNYDYQQGYQSSRPIFIKKKKHKHKEAAKPTNQTSAMAAQDVEAVPLNPDRAQLEKEFKPFFEKYQEKDGLPLRMLKRKLQEAGISEHLPHHKVEFIIRQADEDQNGHLSYDEFIDMVTSEEGGVMIRKAELTRFQQSIRAAISSVVPNHAKSRRTGDVEVVEDYVDHYNCRPPPLFMILISVVEVIVFVVYAVKDKDTNPTTATSGVPMYSPLIYNPARRYEAWRYLTYMLLHQGYVHLIFNLIFQLVLGIPLEMVHKWWRVGIVYSLGVVAGSLAHSVTDMNTLLAGASGGCYALIGAHFAIVVMNWKEMTHDWMGGFMKFVCSAPFRLVIWVLFAGVDIGMAVYKRYTGDGKENIGYAAHLGGALAGILLGIPVLKNIDEKPWERYVWWIALIVYLCAVIFAVCWNTFWPKFPETDWRPCCPYPIW